MGGFLSSIRATFPDQHLLQSQAFVSTNMSVIETSFLTLEKCVCDQFHFLIPLRQAPVIRTENKLYNLKTMSVFPCNPMQAHQVEDTGIKDFKALIIYMDKKLLQSAAEEMFGKGNLELRSDCFLFNPRLKKLVYAFMHECQADQPGCSLMLESLAVEAAILLLRESHYNPSSLSFLPSKYQENNCIARAIEYITDNYQQKLSLNDLAAETHYSTFHFLRLFKHYTGKTPFEYLLQVKIEKAMHLLKNTNYSIADISYLSGFSSCSYFSQISKKKTGISPSEYRLNK